MIAAAFILAATLKVGAGLAHPVLITNQQNTTYMKVWLEGLPLEAANRPPVNLAVVIDRSGSMGGEKMEQAKAAAMMVVDRLGSQDIVSIVSYDDVAEVLVPATRVSDRDSMKQRIGQLYARGSTALFAGVSRGLFEVAKFKSPERVSRVILLSDGQANVGPSSPNELGKLGASAGRDGIAVTTIGLGLGYNEDLMSQLAQRSDGNHAFAENASDLKRLFDSELGDVLSVVAQGVQVIIDFQPGCKPLRAMNRDAEIRGQQATLRLNQLYANQEKYVLFEIEVAPEKNETSRTLARVKVEQSKGPAQTYEASARFTSKASDVAASENKPVMVAVTEIIATERNKLALDLRDKGKVQEARQQLESNARYLEDQSNKLGSDKLRSLGTKQLDSSKRIEDDKRWNQTRKNMVKEQHEVMNQQSY